MYSAETTRPRCDNLVGPRIRVSKMSATDAAAVSRVSSRVKLVAASRSQMARVTRALARENTRLVMVPRPMHPALPIIPELAHPMS